MNITWKHLQIWLSEQIRSPLPIETPPPQADQIVTDSRKISAGQWFVPLRGAHFDGHDFLEQVRNRQVRGVLSERPLHDLPCIHVKDTLKSLQLLAQGWRRLLGIPTIALTGSSGKTTTKELLLAVLSQSHSALGTQGNENNEIGVPLTILRARSQHTALVVEMGARHAHDIHPLVALADPDISICLNIGKAHLGVFGSREELARTKLEIFSQSRNDTICIGNQDDSYIADYLKHTRQPRFGFGFDSESDFRILTSHSTGTTTRFQLKIPKQKPCWFEVPSPHQIMSLNASAAIASAIAMGVDIPSIQAGLRTFAAIPGRFQIIGNQDLTLIDDSYNANPSSMRAGFESVAGLAPSQPYILVLGDMLELGSESADMHVETGRQAVSRLQPDGLYLVGTHAEDMARGATEIGYDQKKTKVFPKVEDLIKTWQSQPPLCHLIYIKGSNGVGLGKFVSFLREYHKL